MKRFGSILVLLALVLAVAAPGYAGSGYSDVADDAWYAEAVAYCREHELMGGVGGGRFLPDAPVDRAAAVTVLWRLAGSESRPADTKFSDVADDAWYAPAVRWAAGIGVAEGWNGRFGADDALTREQFAAMLWRFFDRPASAPANAPKDASDISPYASEAARWAAAAGLMSGGGDGCFLPKATATRAQLAQVVMRAAELLEVTDQVKEKGITAFDSALISFLESEGFGKENYMVSPTSLRAALALAAAGANGETQAQLLGAMEFSSVDEMNDWYGSVRAQIDAFADDLAEAQEQYEAMKQYYPNGSAPDRAFEIANSVWHNADKPGTMSPDYIAYVAKQYDAAAADVATDRLTGAVNGWVDEKTHGLIPRIADDLSDVDAALVNALYLRTSWLTKFQEGNTESGDFTTIDGAKVQKQFMRKQEKLLYYEDDDSQLVVLPMQGGIRAVFVLGDNSDLPAKLDKAGTEEVIVKLPKFDLETSLERRELVRFLAARGAELPLSPAPGAADFSVMSADSDWYISDIIQKSKIKLDEDGIEAAAVTALIMKTTSALIVDPPEPKEFTADHPFSFYLLSGDGAGELLFYGQVVR